MGMTTSINHYIPQNYSPIEHEYVEPRADDYFIYWLFRYRCIRCRQAAQEINEIVPRARHSAYHQDGVTEKKIFDMRIARMVYLKSVGREMYV
jgi:hypothetical protein